MTELVREQLEILPFIPLTIHVSDGQLFYVDHADFAFIAQDGQTLEIHFLSKRVAHVSIRHISSLETTFAEPSI